MNNMKIGTTKGDLKEKYYSENSNSNSNYGVESKYVNSILDSSDYSESESDKDDVDTDDDLFQISQDEQSDIKYLSIYDSNYGRVDEQKKRSP